MCRQKFQRIAGFWGIQFSLLAQGTARDWAVRVLLANVAFGSL
jgi:hypothetical protein